MPVLKGDAAIVYNPGGGDVVLPCSIPLFRPIPGFWQRRWVRENDLGSAREVLATRSTPLYEVQASLRFIDTTAAVLAWIFYAVNGGLFRYRPSLAAPANEIPDILLVEPTQERIQLPRESSRMSRGEVSFESMIWRRTDGGTWALLPGMHL